LPSALSTLNLSSLMRFTDLLGWAG